MKNDLSDMPNAGILEVVEDYVGDTTFRFLCHHPRLFIACESEDFSPLCRYYEPDDKGWCRHCHEYCWSKPALIDAAKRLKKRINKLIKEQEEGLR